MRWGAVAQETSSLPLLSALIWDHRHHALQTCRAPSNGFVNVNQSPEGQLLTFTLQMSNLTSWKASRPSSSSDHRLYKRGYLTTRFQVPHAARKPPQWSFTLHTLTPTELLDTTAARAWFWTGKPAVTRSYVLEMFNWAVTLPYFLLSLLFMGWNIKHFSHTTVQNKYLKTLCFSLGNRSLASKYFRVPTFLN